MSVDIVEIGHDSHRFIHIKNIYTDLVKRKHDVRLVITRESLNNPTAVELKKIMGYKCIVIKSKFTKMANKRMRVGISQLLSYIIIWKCYNSLNYNDKPDYVFMPMIDDCIHLIGLLGSPFGKVKFFGLSMAKHISLRSTGVIAPPPRGALIKKMLISRLLHNNKLKCLFSIVKPFFDEIKICMPEFAYKVKYIPDPVKLPNNLDDVENVNVRKSHSIPIDSRIILVYGAIDKRKGISYLLNAMVCQQFPENVVVWVCGVCKKSGIKILSTALSKKLINDGRLFIWDKFLSKEEEHSVLNTSDVVWVAYPNFYVSSGVQLLAAGYRKPTISAPYGIIGWCAKEYKTGILIDVKIHENVAKNISVLFSDKEKYKKYSLNGRQLAVEHSMENFVSSICALITEE